MIQEVQNLSLEVLIDGVYPENGKEIGDHYLCGVGLELSRDKASFLEKVLSTKPNSYPIHGMLYGFYAHAVQGKEATATDADKAAYKRELLWLIRNRPDSFILLGGNESLDDQELNRQAKQLWLRHLEAAVPHKGILLNAFDFFYLDCRDLEVAEWVGLRGQSLSPGGERWAENLRMVYCERIDMSYGKEKQEWAAKAVEQFQLFRRMMTNFEEGTAALFPKEGETVVFRLGYAALIAGQVEQAQECAQELQGFDTDKFELQAYALAGLISLQQGDVPGACRSLAHAAKAYTGSHYLTLALAEELWYCKETDAVVDFLRTCAAKGGSYYPNEIAELINAIESGKVPEWPYGWDR